MKGLPCQTADKKWKFKGLPSPLWLCFCSCHFQFKQVFHISATNTGWTSYKCLYSQLGCSQPFTALGDRPAFSYILNSVALSQSQRSITVPHFLIPYGWGLYRTAEAYTVRSSMPPGVHSQKNQESSQYKKQLCWIIHCSVPQSFNKLF